MTTNGLHIRSIAKEADACVIGAGIVGITAALELQRRGVRTILVDKGDPGMETSYGNAGVISSSTVLNANNPTVFAALPGILFKRSPSVTYRLLHACSEFRWILSFLNYSRRRHTERIATAIQNLQQLSIRRHQALITEAGAQKYIQRCGLAKGLSRPRGIPVERAGARVDGYAEC